MEALVTMIGWVGGPVEFRVGRHQVSVASFRLASTPRIRRGESWVDGPTTWLTVTAYRALAEHLDSSVSSGEPVIVVGRLRNQRWNDAEGRPQQRTVLEASTVGHDLARGTASFRKAVRRMAPPGDPAAGEAEGERFAAEDSESAGVVEDAGVVRDAGVVDGAAGPNGGPAQPRAARAREGAPVG